MSLYALPSKSGVKRWHKGIRFCTSKDAYIIFVFHAPWKRKARQLYGLYYKFMYMAVIIKRIYWAVMGSSINYCTIYTALFRNLWSRENSVTWKGIRDHIIYNNNWDLYMVLQGIKYSHDIVSFGLHQMIWRLSIWLMVTQLFKSRGEWTTRSWGSVLFLL